jgi:methylated-DNA-protein-cysteine methyltransferase-like protein
VSARRPQRPAAPRSRPDPGEAGLSAFEAAVARVVEAIPAGATLSYGGVALRAGKPRGARAVVRALRRLGEVPWWRVIRGDGTLAIEVAAEQGRRLRAEGVRVEGRRVRRRDDGSTARNPSSRSAERRPGARSARPEQPAGRSNKRNTSLG